MLIRDRLRRTLLWDAHCSRRKITPARSLSNNLGNCHQVLGDLPQAQRAYQQVLSLNPNDARAMSNLGTVLLAMGQIESAVILLRAATELEPEVALHAVNLGAALCQQRKFSDAATILRRAVDLDKTNAEAAY